MSQWQNEVLLLGSAVAIEALLVGVLLYVRRRRISRLRDQQRLPDELSVRSDVRDMMDQLERLAERIDQQAERRVSEVRKLLTEADSTMAKLESMVSKLQAVADMPEPTIGSARHQPPPGGPQSAGLTRQRRSEILRLKSQGLDAVEIARRMQMNVGEVELVMNLHPAPPGTPT